MSTERLYALPLVNQITRRDCVEGWSMIGERIGMPLSAFLKRIVSDLTARCVGFEYADGYCETIGMATALHPQTLMASRSSDDILPTRHGYPFKIRISTQLGFEYPRFVWVTNQQPTGCRIDRGYNWFSGI